MMSGEAYQQQILNVSSLQEIEELRTSRPWRDEQFASFCDTLLQQREAYLQQREAYLQQRETNVQQREALLKAQAMTAGTFYTCIDALFECGELPTGTDVQFYKSCCRMTREETEAALAEEGKLEQEKQRRQRKRNREIEEEETKQEYDESIEDSPVPGAYFCRSGAASARKQIDPYAATDSAARNNRNSPATKDGQSRISTHSQNRRVIWKTAAVGAPNSGEIAHLVPAGVEHANSYWFVTDFLFGMKNRKWREVCKLIHGSNTKGKKKDKVHLTGIKHMVTNKVLLAGQKEYFDNSPCVIILPIMTRDEALKWRGCGYPAIMLIDKYGEDTQLRTVCSLTFFTHEGGTKAETSDLTTAGTLLQDYTRAILFAQQERKPKECTFSLKEATAFYPKLRDNYGSCNVRKVFFQDNNGTEGHPAPDPLLLLSKSISVLQRRHGFDITAAAEPGEDGNGSPSEMSIIAEEEYLRRREEAMVYPNPVGLHIAIY